LRNNDIAELTARRKKQMNSKHSQKFGPGSPVAFTILCIGWFLDVSGLLSGLLL